MKIVHIDKDTEVRNMLMPVHMRQGVFTIHSDENGCGPQTSTHVEILDREDNVVAILCYEHSKPPGSQIWLEAINARPVEVAT